MKRANCVSKSGRSEKAGRGGLERVLTQLLEFVSGSEPGSVVLDLECGGEQCGCMKKKGWSEIGKHASAWPQLR